MAKFKPVADITITIINDNGNAIKKSDINDIALEIEQMINEKILGKKRELLFAARIHIKKLIEVKKDKVVMDQQINVKRKALFGKSKV